MCLLMKETSVCLPAALLHSSAVGESEPGAVIHHPGYSGPHLCTAVKEMSHMLTDRLWMDPQGVLSQKKGR